MRTPQLSFDQLFFDRSGSSERYLVAGVDEAGRGPLAGSVYAAAVILDPERRIEGLADSKVLTEERREELAAQIKERAVSYSIAEATVEEIDELNILHASMLPTKAHIAALAKHGVLDVHRRSFAPVKQHLQTGLTDMSDVN